MAEVTEQDRAKARELVAARVKMIWSNAFSLGTANEQAEEIERIERALAAAREQAVPPKGHVLTDDGTVLRVLGTLPVTADGCVVCYQQATVYHPVVGEMWTLEGEPYAAWNNGVGKNIGDCYSTRSASEAARPTT